MDAPVIVPSHRPGVGVSLPPITRCSRCGRPEPGNVCVSCTARASRLTAGYGPNHHLSTASKSRCAACRAPLRGSYRQASLCPSCQARHAAVINVRSTLATTNPYPVIPHIAKSARPFVYYPPTSTTTFAPPLHNTADLAVPSALPPISAPHNVTHPANAAPRVCVRFGCGTRLSSHVPGDICAGFVRQTRPVSPRVEQTCPPLPESVDLMCTSRVREDGPGEEARTERDNDSEVELVYPDDTPVADSASAPVAQTEHPKPVEDGHGELELVYPEDTVETTRPSLPKKRLNIPLPPTTLRELFQGGLQTIPTLQNLTWVSDKAQPRPCPSQGCTDLVPAQSGLQRCVKCAIAEWKRRRSASMDTEPPRRRSVMSTSTMEERKVATILDDMSDVEEEHEVPPPSSLPNKDSRHERPIPGWDSDLTELSSDSDAESTPDLGSEPVQSHGEPSGFKIRIPLLVTHLPPGSLLQKCANKKCNIALPKDCRWKTCDPCRNYQKRYQCLRLENKQRRLLGLETLDSPELSWRRLRSHSPDLEMEMLEMNASLTPETSRPCTAKYCSNRIPLPEVYRWKTCVRCRAKARYKARQKKRNALVDMSDASSDEVVPRFPAYQNRGQLVASFGTQLKGFVEGQIVYYRAKLREEQDGRESWTLDRLPMMFVFAGECSVVTGGRGETACHTSDGRRPEDPVEAMRQEVASVVFELGCVLHAKFRPGEAFAIDTGGILMRFVCPLELITQLRPMVSGSGNGAKTTDGVGDSSVPGGPEPSFTPVADSGVSTSKDERDKDKDKDVSDPRPSPLLIPLAKMLTGELEVVVIPDESHRLFRGRRTVVRYRMVG